MTVDHTDINLCVAVQLLNRGFITLIDAEVYKWMSFYQWAPWFRLGTTYRKALHTSERAQSILNTVKYLEVKNE